MNESDAMAMAAWCAGRWAVPVEVYNDEHGYYWVRFVFPACGGVYRGEDDA